MNTNEHEWFISASCPFSIAKIRSHGAKAHDSWLIRENDAFGEYPHIYAKICIDAHQRNAVIVLSDTGCGTTLPNTSSGQHSLRPQPNVWNLRTFLEYTINPSGLMPYLVITTHCHYDHIMGIGSLPLTDSKKEDRSHATQVLTSGLHKSFVTPYKNLQKHSLCWSEGLQAPRYSVTTWAKDFSQAVYFQADGSQVGTNITIIQTPGHTPDSLSWYDSDLHLLCVGDSFYTNESTHTENAPWGREPPLPVYFDIESNVATWWESLAKLDKFVSMKNAELKDTYSKTGSEEWTLLYKDDIAEPKFSHVLSCLETGRFEPWLSVRISEGGDAVATDPKMLSLDVPRVQLCAAHTTLGIDAETAIRDIRATVLAVLRDEVPSKRIADGPRGEERWLWDYSLKGESSSYGVLSPIVVIEEGRKELEKELKFS